MVMGRGLKSAKTIRASPEKGSTPFPERLFAEQRGEMQTKNADSGLMRRGLLLLGLMAVLAGVVLYIVLRRPQGEVPPERLHPEWLALLATAPQAGLPATIAWTGLPQLETALPSAAGWEIRY